MAEMKTRKTRASVARFIAEIADPQRRADCRTIHKLMKGATRTNGAMYGASIVGYGHSQIRYADGRSAQWFAIGFSPRKQNLTLYVIRKFPTLRPLLERLGKHRASKACLYVKRIDDVDLDVLKQLIDDSAKAAQPSLSGGG